MEVSAFYEAHPYPPPADDLVAYRRSWNDRRRRADSHLFWPAERYRDDRSVLVAGCGTTQAAHYALRWPNAAVIGIDVGAESLAFTAELKRNHALDNLELHQLPLERAAELERTFDHVVCTGVLHHLPDPDAGLRALRRVLAPAGAMNLMVYAPYGRAGVYMLQELCRRLRIDASETGIRDLAAGLKILPQDHPLAPLLRNSPDFADAAGLADALLHPRDRAYAVPQLMDLINGAEMTFGRWIRQAPYLVWCGAPAGTPLVSRFSPRFSRRCLARIRADPPARHARRAETVTRRRDGGADQPQSHLHRPLLADRRGKGSATRRNRRQTHDRGYLRRARTSRGGAEFFRTALAMGPSRFRYYGPPRRMRRNPMWHVAVSTSCAMRAAGR
jgi:SAM-dependent methyltransferase